MSKRTWRLQYSLASLFGLTTLAASFVGWRYSHHWEIEERHGDGSRIVRIVRRLGWDRIVNDGPERRYDEQGHLIDETEWRLDRRHGLHRRWRRDHPFGIVRYTLVEEGLYVDDCRSGFWTFPDERGLTVQGEYLALPDGEIAVGVWYSSDTRGTVWERSEYDRHGEPTGLWIRGSEIGTRIELRYGPSDSLQIDHFAAKATQANRTVEFTNGRYVDYGWTKNGLVKWCGEWRNHLRHGRWRFCDDAGEHLYTIKFDNGHVVRVNDRATTPILQHPSFQGSCWSSATSSSKRTRGDVVTPLPHGPRENAIYELQEAFGVDLFEPPWSLSGLQECFGYQVIECPLDEAIRHLFNDDFDQLANVIVDRAALQADGISPQKKVRISFPTHIPRIVVVQLFFDEQRLACFAHNAQLTVTSKVTLKNDPLPPPKSKSPSPVNDP